MLCQVRTAMCPTCEGSNLLALGRGVRRQLRACHCERSPPDQVAVLSLAAAAADSAQHQCCDTMVVTEAAHPCMTAAGAQAELNLVLFLAAARLGRKPAEELLEGSGSRARAGAWTGVRGRLRACNADAVRPRNLRDGVCRRCTRNAETGHSPAQVLDDVVMRSSLSGVSR